VSHWKLTGLVLFLLVAASAFAADENFTVLHGRVVAVGDGDSLTLLVGGQKVKIRLAQIDAPELQQPYGTTSKAALAKMVENQKVRAEVIELDRYGRSVAEVYLDGLHVNREMVELGHAWAYTKYSHTTLIIELEDGARAAKKGLWALPENQRVPPWIWRHPPRAPRPEPGPLACGTRNYCSEMAGCEEARFYFEQCDVHSLDGDGDGVPCESLCTSAR